MKVLRSRFFLTTTLLLFAVSILTSSTPKLVSHQTQRDFEKGKPEGVSINGYGAIQLAPKVIELYNTDMPFIWTSVADYQGNFYIAGGNEGKVVKIRPQKNSSLFFDVGDKQIYALAVDSQNNLLIGTSPEGKVYKVPKDGSIELEEAAFFDPEEIYIWSILVDKQNNLYVATGEKGNIYKVNQDGSSSLFYESEDAHIRTMIFDRSGSLIAGTSNKGMLIRIDSAGKAFVLYDSPLIEITALNEDQHGNLFAAAAGDAFLQRTVPRTQPAEPAPAAEINGVSGEEEDVLELPVQTISASGPPRVGKHSSELYQIDPDGTIRQFWSPGRDRIHAMISDPAGNILVGTGEPGRIYLLNPAGEHTLLCELDELQITSLGQDSGGNILVCTSNAAKAYRLAADFNRSGEYLSDVIDASVASQWGSISWEANLPKDTELVFYTRSGNTEKPDKTWSPWSKRLTNPTGQNITSPPARFLQYKAAFSTKNGKKSAVLKEVNFSYLQKNIAPQIQDIFIHAPGDYYPESVKNAAVDTHVGNGSLSNNKGAQNNHPGRKIFRRGARSVSWKAKDDNGDDLSFNVSYRGEDEDSWKSLIRDFRGNLYSWDSELLPDGRYFIKVVATDVLSNPPAMALTSVKISQPFKVDNSGPKVSAIEVQTQRNGAKISFVVQDEMTNVNSVEYGLNAENWKLVYPVDGICDSKLEKFEIEARSLIKGSNTIVIKARDEIGNIGFGKTIMNY